MTRLHTPTLFFRHKLPLHGVFVEGQCWFSAQDFGRLMGRHLAERMIRKLAMDQYCWMELNIADITDTTLMISESGLYTLLAMHHIPENRHLRAWLTHRVVPVLNRAALVTNAETPQLRILEWPDKQLHVMQWRNEPWVRLRDLPLLATAPASINQQLATPPLNRLQRLWRRFKSS